jgi:pimeloyl-ACP methyl ester carboxylesterase
MAKQLLASKARPTAPWHARRADDAYGAGAEPDWREVNWRQHLRQVQIAGRRVNYVDIGEGEGCPVVFVHGLAGQWQNWLENIPAASRDRRVIALDMPGHGSSEIPAERITIPRYGRWVEALCDALDLGEVALVGNSMGGFITSEVAIQFPERVNRLVLVSAAGITTANVFRAPTRTLGRVAAVLSATSAARHRSVAARPVTRHMALTLVARHPSRLKADLAYEGVFKGVGKPGFHDALRACLEYDFRERLGEIRCPTLIVWGEDDTILPVRDAHEFERLIPNTRSVVMKDTGHIPMLERPTEFNELLAEFLSEEAPLEAPSDGAPIEVPSEGAPVEARSEAAG